MSPTIHKQKYLLLTYGTVLILSLLVLVFIQKGEAVSYLNQWHNPGLDRAMSWITKLGEWEGFLMVLTLVILWHKWRHLFAYLIGCALMLVLVSWLKHIAFPNYMRPSVIMENEGLHFIDNVNINRKFSFPSGHTSAAFTYFIFLAFLQNRSWLKITLLLIAILVGGSRIYLAQHFLEDVVAGSVLGVSVAALSYFGISEKWFKRYRDMDFKIWK